MSQKTAVLVIDMQKDFLTPQAPYRMVGAEKVVDAIKMLLAGSRRSHWQIIYIVRGHDPLGVDVEKFRVDVFRTGGGFAVCGSDGMRVLPEIAPEAGDIIIEKVRFSAFFATKLDLVLRRLGIERLILCGAQYPNCIRATAVDGLAYDYDVQICRDATWAASEEVAKANIYDLENMGVKCLTLPEIL